MHRMPDTDRLSQAMILWQRGWGSVLGHATFEAYMESVPEIPSTLKSPTKHFPLLVLVDGRPDPRKLYHLSCLQISTRDMVDLRRYEQDRKQEGVRWMRCQNGRRYRDFTADEARQKFQPDEIGLDLAEGLAIHVQFPRMFIGHHLLLPNAVASDARRSPGCLGRREGQLCFGFNFGGLNMPGFGAASRLNA